MENLKNEMELRAQEKYELESRILEAENKVLELNTELQSVGSFQWWMELIIIYTEIFTIQIRF